VNESRPNYRFFETKDWRVIFELQDGIIVFDEGQLLLDARNWEALPIEFRQLLQKGRHEGLDFVVLTQSIMQVDVAYRRLIHEATKVWRVFSWKKFQIGLFIIWDVDISGLEKKKTVVLSHIRFAMADDWRYYDSHALRSSKKPKEVSQCECGIEHRVMPETPPVKQ